jgi:6-phosphogluconolactonase
VQDDSISFGNAPAAIFDTVDAAVDACANDLSLIIDSSVRERGVCRIAICGGNAARYVLSRLVDLRAHFDGVEFYLADERCVGPESIERNDHLLIELLVESHRMERSAIYSIPAEYGPHEGAARYAEMINALPRFDAAFLSVGDDGHVASIFPNHSSIESTTTTVAVDDSPRPPAERVSLSINTLRASTHRLVAAFGEEKSAVIARIHGGWDPPAVQVHPTRWYLDRAAVRDLSASDR